MTNLIDIYHSSVNKVEKPVFGAAKPKAEDETGGTILQENDGTYTVGPEYWAGWVLAYYQWLTRRSFAYMYKKGLGIKEVVSMYYPLHEADLSRFAAAADGVISRG